MLTGNQVGLLLADFLLEHAGPGPTPLVINSIVSSPMLASIAAAYGARFEATLTGFKWIANAALSLDNVEGTRFVFGYEEPWVTPPARWCATRTASRRPCSSPSWPPTAGRWARRSGIASPACTGATACG